MQRKFIWTKLERAHQETCNRIRWYFWFVDEEKIGKGGSDCKDENEQEAKAPAETFAAAITLFVLRVVAGEISTVTLLCKHHVWRWRRHGALIVCHERIYKDVVEGRKEREWSKGGQMRERF
jgi:hypothetical protein